MDLVLVEGESTSIAPTDDRKQEAHRHSLLCLRGSFPYTAYFCEENAYLMCEQLLRRSIADASNLFVVFISNAQKIVPLFYQKASTRSDGFVAWDYHVICIQKFQDGAKEALVWDLDTTLPFPTQFSEYVRKTFQAWLASISSYQRLFRVLSAPMFLKYFASDRRHMRTPEGPWMQPPPPYECIRGHEGSVHNLEDYNALSDNLVLQMGPSTRHSIASERLGATLDEQSLLQFFNS